jgi:hypothetical protein
MRVFVIQIYSGQCFVVRASNLKAACDLVRKALSQEPTGIADVTDKLGLGPHYQASCELEGGK